MHFHPKALFGLPFAPSHLALETHSQNDILAAPIFSQRSAKCQKSLARHRYRPLGVMSRKPILLTDPKLAWQYSGAQSQGRAVARVLIKEPEGSGLKPDPFSQAGSRAFITERDIPASSMLGSTKARSGRGREVFQARFNEAVDDAIEWSDEELLNETGFIKRDLRKINKEEAGILIDDVQSDSEDDGG